MNGFASQIRMLLCGAICFAFAGLGAVLGVAPGDWVLLISAGLYGALGAWLNDLMLEIVR